MSSVVSCPNCEKKLAVKDEFKGKTLICPQCKGRFSVPADDAPAGDLLDALDTSPAGDVGFLDSLGPSAAGPAKSSTAPASVYAAPRPANGKARSAVAAGRARKKAAQMKMIYIGGGIAAAVLLVIIVVYSATRDPGTGSGVKEPENIRFGLTEKQRKRLFMDMFHAVDVNGPTKICREEWRRMGSELRLSDSQLSDVLKEGLDSGWDQPAIEATQDQKQKTNRRDWIRKINETGRDPIMSL